MGLVIAVSGLPAAGKGEFATILANRSIPVVSMGDVVRAEVTRRGIPEEPSVFGQIATELRQEFGEDVIAQRLTAVVDGLLVENEIVLIEGLRGIAERKVFSEHWGENFVVVAVTANLEIRYERVQSRGRSEDGTLDDLLIRDEREKGWGLGQIIDEAEKQFPNESDLENLEDLVSNWLNLL